MWVDARPAAQNKKRILMQDFRCLICLDRMNSLPGGRGKSLVTGPICTMN